MRALAVPAWSGPQDDPRRLIRTIDEWAASAALRRIVAASGGDTAERAGAELMAWLGAFSDRWDFRAGGERDGSVGDVSPGLAQAVSEGLAALGLSGRETPLRGRYDAILMTGGMVRAGIVKPRFVRALLDDGLKADEIVFLGGFRPFSVAEAALARELGVPGDDEWDAMEAGMVRAFALDGVTVSDTRPSVGARDKRWSAAGSDFRVVAAPSSNPARRADTADTFRHWAASGQAGSVLVVTTPIYVPYQATVATEVLGLERGHRVETVGVAAWASDLGPATQPFLPAHHLQELRSAVRAMRRLRERAAVSAGA